MANTYLIVNTKILLLVIMLNNIFLQKLLFWQLWEINNSIYYLNLFNFL